MPSEQPPTAADRPAATMRAIVQDEYGTDPHEVLRFADIDVPSIAPDQVLVRVRAASIDRGTWHVMAGLPYAVRLAGFGVRRPKHTNPGRSLAGTVAAVGSDVSAVAPGDEVWGIAPGALAQYVAVDADQLDATPQRLTVEEAAAAPISGLAALQAVRDHGRVGPGTSVLVIGASGGVGSFAVQIAKAAGAEVTGVASTAKLDLVRALGADHVVDYTRQDITDGGRRHDVILDVGGNRRLSQLRRALAPEGRLVIVGGETDGRWLGGTDRQLRAVLWSPFLRQTLGTFISAEKGEDLAALRALVEAGDVTPMVERTVPLEDVATAIEHLVAGDVRGKVAITVP